MGRAVPAQFGRFSQRIEEAAVPCIDVVASQCLHHGAVPFTALGQWHVQGLLQRLGHDEWIAGSPDEYVERVVALCARAPALRAARVALRERMRLRLCDASAQARELAVVFRALWQEACIPA
jgi:hypothetical protein